MDPEELRDHLEAISTSYLAGDEVLVRSISAACWPGGGADRADPVAIQWLRRWRPLTSHAVLPVCSCQIGRCSLCN
jgi:hypothetical protein